MKKTSILMKEMTHSYNTKKILNKSLKHHLRIEFEDQNFNMNFDECGKNIYRVYNEKKGMFEDLSVDDDVEKEKVLKDLLDKLLEDPNKKNTIDPKQLKNLKRDFKSFIETDKEAITKRKPRDKDLTEEDLKRRLDLTIKINDFLNNGLKGNVLENDEFEEYQKLVNNKRFEKLQFLKNNNKKNFNDKTIQNLEMFFKIPGGNGVNLSAEESRKILTDFYNENFPMYEVIATFEHNDEKVKKYKKDENGEIKTIEDGDHAHAIISCKNKNTGEYDYTKQKYNFVKNQILEELKRLNHEEDYKNWYVSKLFEANENAPKKFLECETDEERVNFLIGEETKASKYKIQSKRFGIIYQDTIYNFVNNHEIFLNRELEANKYLYMGETREEIIKNKKRLSFEDKNGTNKTNYNGVKLAEENQKELNDLIIETTEELEIKTELLEETKEELEKTKKSVEKVAEKLEKLEEDYQNKEIELKNKLDIQINTQKDTLNKELKPLEEKVNKYEKVVKSSNYEEYLKYNENVEYGSLNEELYKKAFDEAYKKHYEEISVDEVTITKIKDYNEKLAEVSSKFKNKETELKNKQNEINNIDIKLSTKTEKLKDFEDFEKITTFYNVDEGVEKFKKSKDKEQVLKKLLNYHKDYSRLKNSINTQAEEIAIKKVKEWKAQETENIKNEIKAEYSLKVGKLDKIEQDLKDFQEKDPYFKTMNNLKVINVFEVLEETINKSREKDTKLKDLDFYKGKVETANKEIIRNENTIKLLNKDLKDFEVVNDTLKEEIIKKDKIIDKLSSRVKTLTNRVKTAINGVRDRENVINYLEDKKNEFMNKGKSIFKSIKNSTNFALWGLDRKHKETASLNEIKYQKDNNETSISKKSLFSKMK